MSKFFILAVVFATAYSLDFDEFLKEHCYEGKERTTADYFSSNALPQVNKYDTNWGGRDNPYATHRNGYVCENFTLTEEDLRNITSDPDTSRSKLKLYPAVFFKNCEILIIHRNWASMFSEVQYLFFDNCKINFKDFISPIGAMWRVNILGMHNCKVYNNGAGLEDVFRDLRYLFLQNTTVELPPLPERMKDCVIHKEKVELKPGASSWYWQGEPHALPQEN